MAMPDSDSGALPASTQPASTLPASTLPVIDLQGLGFDAGAHLLVKHALAALPVGGQLRVTGSAPG
ncbi:ferritin-like domain-containing protein, partial [Delftia sp. BR1]